jgi:tRNA(fMet)-specific endonuclease VapC
VSDLFCLDTNIVVFALNGRKPEIAARLDAELARATPMLVPAIVLFELRYGYAKSAQRVLNEERLIVFLQAGFSQPEFDASDAAEAGEIRAHLEHLGQPIGPYDILIAAQARRRHATLVTLNRAEFDRIPGLSVTDWSD